MMAPVSRARCQYIITLFAFENEVKNKPNKKKQLTRAIERKFSHLKFLWLLCASLVDHHESLRSPHKQKSDGIESTFFVVLRRNVRTTNNHHHHGETGYMYTWIDERRRLSPENPRGASERGPARSFAHLANEISLLYG